MKEVGGAPENLLECKVFFWKKKKKKEKPSLEYAPVYTSVYNGVII